LQKTFHAYVVSTVYYNFAEHSGLNLQKHVFSVFSVVFFIRYPVFLWLVNNLNVTVGGKYIIN